MLSQLPKFTSDKLLVGLELSDDAAVYQLNDTQAIIQTLDFFTPIVDDPYMFGQIAAANALSDIYAMGGQPLIALNIVGFPKSLDPSILTEILKGGADKVKEANALLVGGHSVEDNEPKYGLSVTGLVHPKCVWTNSNANIGDVLVLTKPIGSGILNTALKADLLDEDDIQKLMNVMATLNKAAAETLIDFKRSAVTDVTGFGLIGHVLEMAQNSQVSIQLNHQWIPVMDKALENAEMGIIPGGTYKNKNFYSKSVKILTGVKEVYEDILYDPQTSGGLIIAMPEKDAHEYIKKLKTMYQWPVSIVGEIIGKQENDIIVI